MNIFGDDGFRDIYGKGLLNKIFLENFFSKLNNFIIKNKVPKIIIGFDTRNSHIGIIKTIIENINYSTIVEILYIPVPSPCVSYLAKKKKSCFLIMITASHFDRKFNGFKFYYKGEKLSKIYERKILNSSKKKYKLKKKKIIFSKIYKSYIAYINKNFKYSYKPSDVLVDFAFGSAASISSKINFLKNVKKINYNYNYNNINKNCGSNHLKKNIKILPYSKFEYCLAYDGDADRLLVHKKNYGIIESEKMILIFLSYLKKKSFPNKVVATNIINPDLIEILKKMRIKTIQTNVGDRNIISNQVKCNSSLGFETSGHYSFDRFMDGIYASGLFLKILKSNKEIIEDILNIDFKYKLKKINLKYNQLKIINKFKNQESKFFKIIIRKSIWENVYRLYIFYKLGDLLRVKKILSKL